MGDYTYYVIDTDLSLDLANTLAPLIPYISHEFAKESKIVSPDHAFFQRPIHEWNGFFCGHGFFEMGWGKGSAGGSHHFLNVVSENAIIEMKENHWHLKIVSCKKMHFMNDMFELFLDFISPYVIARESQIIGEKQHDQFDDETDYDLVKYINKTIYIENHFIQSTTADHVNRIEHDPNEKVTLKPISEVILQIEESNKRYLSHNKRDE